MREKKWIEIKLEQNERAKAKRLREGKKAYLRWLEHDMLTYPVAGFNGRTRAQILGLAT